MRKNNSGFSLVELIIVIAIMAILAGAIAPALIRYIDKSRKSNDITAGKTIKTAVETALTDEKSFELLTTGDENTTIDADGNSFDYVGYVVITPSSPNNGYSDNGVELVPSANADYDPNTFDSTDQELADNFGEKTPKIKFKKAANGTLKPTTFFAFCTAGGEIYVGVGTGVGEGEFYQLCPTISKYYSK